MLSLSNLFANQRLNLLVLKVEYREDTCKPLDTSHDGEELRHAYLDLRVVGRSFAKFGDTLDINNGDDRP